MSDNEVDFEQDTDVPDVLDIIEDDKDFSPDSPSLKSMKKYLVCYNEFKAWCKKKSKTPVSEEACLDYFSGMSQTHAPPTLWARFSMLKATLHSCDNIDIGKYDKLIAFLKKNNAGYQKKRSKIFTKENVSKFCIEASDNEFLAMKVALIMGISGSCRREELTNMKLIDIEDHNTMLLVKIPKTKTRIERSFIVVGDFYQICQKYMKLRPENTDTDRFFLSYRKGKCIKQPIGINAFGNMPRVIATFLKLPDPELYTGHSFRRTSAKLLVDAGSVVTTLIQQGEWKPNTVAEGCTENSVNSSTKISQQMKSNISFKRSATTAQTTPDKRPAKRLKVSGKNVKLPMTKFKINKQIKKSDIERPSIFFVSNKYVENYYDENICISTISKLN